MTATIDQALNTFFTSHELVTIEKDKDISHHDEPLHFVYQIKSGLVKEYMVSEQGTELALNIFGPSDIVPLLLDPAVKRQSCFQTHVKSELYRASITAFQSFLHSHQHISEKLNHRINEKFTGVTRRLGCLVFCHAHARIIESILFLGQNFGQSVGTGIKIPTIFTHKDIASIAGVTRETASNELSKLTQQKHLIINGRSIFIPDIDALLHELDHHKEKK